MSKRIRREPRVHTLYKIVRRRDPKTGRFTSRRGVREEYQYRRTKTGKFAEAIEILTKKTVKKVGLPDRWDGMIGDALAEKNILISAKKAKRLEIIIKGKDFRDKAHRIKKVIDIRKVEKIASGLIKTIMEAMEKRGFRTSYDLSLVPYGSRRPRSRAARLRQLHDTEITVIARG